LIVVVIATLAAFLWVLWPRPDRTLNGLLWAVRGGDVATFKELLADHPEWTKPIAEEPLFLEAAAQMPSPHAAEIARELLRRGADPNCADQVGHAALHWTVFSNNVPVAEALLEASADVDRRGYGGRTALHDAALLGRPDVADVLVRHGANCNAKDDHGSVPLDMAIGGSFKKTPEDCARIVESLCSHGADLGETESGSPYVLLAAEQGNVPVLKVLVAHGAKVNTRDAHGRTTLFAAFDDGFPRFPKTPERQRAETVEYLASQGADVNVADDKGMRPIDLAVGRGDMLVVETLLRRAANCNTKDGSKATPLSMAIGEPAARRLPETSARLVELLCSHGANVSETNRHGASCLQLAAECGNVPAMKVLIAHGAQVNARNTEGQTPIFGAVVFDSHVPARDRVQAIEYLASQRADVNATDDKGMHPIDFAFRNGAKLLVDALLRCGAKEPAPPRKTFGNSEKGP